MYSFRPTIRIVLKGLFVESRVGASLRNGKIYLFDLMAFELKWDNGSISSYTVLKSNKNSLNFDFF